MVVGDVYELYLPSEKAVGDHGHADAKVPPGKLVIVKLELVEVSGKSRSALKCHPREPDRHCTKAGFSYVNEVKDMSSEEIMELDGSLVVVRDDMDPETAEWVYLRLHILM